MVSRERGKKSGKFSHTSGRESKTSMTDVKGAVGEESVKMDLWNLDQRFHGTMKQNYENNHQVKKILMAINVEARKTLSVWQQYKALYKESGKYNQHESDDISGT